MTIRIAIASCLLLLASCQTGPRTVFVPCTNDYCLKCEGKHEFTCPRCEGKGSKRCQDKMGNLCEGGRKRCPACNGSATAEDGSSPCAECDGTGRITCQACQGTGTIDCSQCNGEGIVPCGEWVTSGGT